MAVKYLGRGSNLPRIAEVACCWVKHLSGFRKGDWDLVRVENGVIVVSVERYKVLEACSKKIGGVTIDERTYLRLLKAQAEEILDEKWSRLQ